uniref:CAP domain-containing protein (inferred by orthology to a zebrafish protein) n=1 Tax=Strongyloides venezuelensis TaxID=75913 RepID=A0A0K0FD11_STRVS
MNPPPLPEKRKGYTITRNRAYANPRLHNRFGIESYIGSMEKLYICDDKLFYNYDDAKKCCQVANKRRTSGDIQIKCQARYFRSYDRNAIKRLNKKKYISNSLSGSKISLPGSTNSLSGSSRSSSRESLAKSYGDLSSRKNSMSGSNTNLLPIGKFMSKSSGDLLYERDSKSRSSFEISKRKNDLTKSSIDLLERRKSLTKSKESLNKNEINDKNKKGSLDEHSSKKITSFQIWHRVWESCSFRCYSKNHYERLRILMLKEINTYRSIHGVEHLVSTQQLVELAQVLADKYAMRQTLEIHKRFAYGVLYTYVNAFSVSVIVRNWYDTNTKYSFRWGKLKSSVAKNFAQLVWKSTKQIGIGIQDEDGLVYVVCLFFPKGNEKGNYKKNILKAKS